MLSFLTADNTKGRRPRKQYGVVVEGQFLQTPNVRATRRLLFLVGILAFLIVVSSLITYGLTEQLETKLQEVAQDTRRLNESNKALQVKLNRIQSFENVASVAAKVQNLQKATQVLEIQPKSAPSESAMLADTVEIDNTALLESSVGMTYSRAQFKQAYNRVYGF